MHHQEHNYSQPHLTPFWGGVLAIGILWVLALWSVAAKDQFGVYDLELSSVAVAQDAPLHASGDYSPNIKRFYSRHQDSHSSLKFSDPHAEFPSADISNLLSVFVSPAQHFYVYIPALIAHQLQTLNAPRAPPLV